MKSVWRLRVGWSVPVVGRCISAARAASRSAMRCLAGLNPSGSGRRSGGGSSLIRDRAPAFEAACSMRRPVVGQTCSAASCGILQWGHRTKRWLMERARGNFHA